MNREKRKRILETAESLFNRFGTQKTGVDEIAQMANVAKGTIYNNFKNKEGIMKELLQKKVSDFETSMNAKLSAQVNAVERLRTLLNERINVRLKTPFLSDGMLKTDERALLYISGELDRAFNNFINSIFDNSGERAFSSEEKKRIISTITFTLRGIEETIRNTIDKISSQQIEKDLDYLIRLIFPEKKNDGSGNMAEVK
jgi:AcrR family transcriptional regulator